MTSFGAVCVDIIAGLAILGWYPAAHPGLTVLALFAVSLVALAVFGALAGRRAAE